MIIDSKELAEAIAFLKLVQKRYIQAKKRSCQTGPGSQRRYNESLWAKNALDDAKTDIENILSEIFKDSIHDPQLLFDLD